MGAGGDAGGAAHDVELVGVLDQAHFIQQGAHVTHRFRRTLAGAALGAQGVEQLGDPHIPGAVVAEGIPEGGLVGGQLAKLFLELADGVGRVETKGVPRAGGAVAKAIPDFPFHVLVAAEQQALRCVAGDQHDHRFRLGKAGEVMDVAVGAVRVGGIPVARLFRRRGQDGDAFAHAGKQAVAAGLEGGEVDGGHHGWAQSS